MSANKFLIRVSSSTGGDQIEIKMCCKECKKRFRPRFDAPTIDDLNELLDFIKSNPDHLKCPHCGK